MLQSGLCDYSTVYIHVTETVTVVEQGADDAAIEGDRNNKHIIFKNCVPFTDCIRTINNTQVGNAKDLDVVMLMYNQ